VNAALFTGDVERGGGLGDAVFVLGDAAVERRVGRLGVTYRQPRSAAAAVRRRVDSRVVQYVDPVALPSAHNCRR